MNIVVISCSLAQESNSRLLAKATHHFLKEQKIPSQFIDLRERTLPLCDGDECYSNPEVHRIGKELSAAQAILLASPIYNFDVSAAAKNLVELTGKAWEDKLVGFLCAAGGQSSYMSLMPFANSLMLDFRCVIVPRFVYATGSSFEGEKVIDADVQRRIEELVHATLKLLL